MNSTTELSERDAETLARVEAELMSGRTFALVAMSARSITGYQPPSESRKYAEALEVLAKGARIGDRAAKLVSMIVPHIPVCGTPGDSVAMMYQAAVNALGKSWHDTVGAASPEPGRPSDHYHDWTLADRLLLRTLLANAQAKFLPTGSRHGWAMRALVEREVREGRLASWAVTMAGGLD